VSPDASGADRDEPSGFEWSFGDAAAPAPAETRDDEQRAPEAVPLGGRFGDYEVQGVLGKGGMGTVYRAREVASRRAVALKVLASRLDEQQRERFRREGELTAALNHPGIVRIFSAGEHRGVSYLAYELIEGAATCEQALRTLDRPGRVALVRDVARALAYAHERGVIHRDLKPTNVLLDQDGRPHVADFGLAHARGLERLTASGAIVGTPLFMSPEQFGARDEQGELGPQTDVWALGVILYQALTGRLPFEARTLIELGAMVSSSSPLAPRRHDATISPDLELVCLTALARRAADRYPHAGALAADLDLILLDQPIARSGTLLARLGRRALGGRARRVGLALAAGATLLVGLVAAAPDLTAHRAPDDVLRARLLEFRRGACTPEALAAAIASASDATALATAHLALAEAGQDVLDHARAAARLDPTRAPAAQRLEARALAAADRPDEAAAALRRAWDDGRDPAALLDLARLMRAESRWAECLAAAEPFLALVPLEPEAWALRTEALLELGRAAEALIALDALTRSARLPWAEPLRAQAARAAGRDPRPQLEAAAARWPDDPRVVAALVVHLLGVGDARAADAYLRQSSARSARRKDELLRLDLAVAALVRRPPAVDVVREAPAAVVAAGARWLLREAERDLAFLARPQWMQALTTDARRARARSLLDAVDALARDDATRGGASLARARLEGPETQAGSAAAEAAFTALGGSPAAVALVARARAAHGRAAVALAVLEATWPGDAWRAWPEAARARGEALLALGRADEAARALEVALGPAATDAPVVEALARALRAAGRDDEAAAAAGRAERLRGARRAEADAITYRSRHELKKSASFDERIALYEEALGLDPLHACARYYRGWMIMTKSEGPIIDGFREMIVGMDADATLLSDEATELFWDLGKFGRDLDGGTSNLRRLLRDLGDEGSGPRLDRVLRGLVCAALVEYEGQEGYAERGLRELSSALDEDPGSALAYCLRGFLALRTGDLLRAEADLEVAREAAPRCANVYFYEALLRGALEASPEQVMERLRAARQAGYPGLLVELLRYPELRVYLRQASFSAAVADLFRER
jgi:predicted Ser/Thr protein kinase